MPVRVTSRRGNQQLSALGRRYGRPALPCGGRGGRPPRRRPTGLRRAAARGDAGRRE